MKKKHGEIENQVLYDSLLSSQLPSEASITLNKYHDNEITEEDIKK